jgi:hypothetical protein
MTAREPARLTLASAADAKRELALHAAVGYLRAPNAGVSSYDAREEALNALCAWAKAEIAAGRVTR